MKIWCSLIFLRVLTNNLESTPLTERELHFTFRESSPLHFKREHSTYREYGGSETYASNIMPFQDLQYYGEDDYIPGLYEGDTDEALW